MDLTKEEFAAQVKEALLHLYDVAYLPRLKLSAIWVGEAGLSWDERAQALRRLLIQAIERLDPGPGLPLRARERRSYAILSARYARSLTSRAVMEELALSERQYWRERHKAIEALVDLLWEDYLRQTCDASISSPRRGEQETVAQEEADLMASGGSFELVNAGEVVRGVVRDLQRLVNSRHIRLLLEISDPPPLLVTDRAALRQVCLNVLCCAFDATVDGLVTLQSVEEAEAVRLSVSTAIRPGLESARGQHGLELKIAHRLVEAQGGRIEVDSEGGGRWSATIVLPKAQRLPILVIDDNRAIVSLFQRYLAGTRYRVVGAETGQKALELVRQVKPAAITLDVMMPSQDGWEILQALRALPESASTPIIVCSILDEPALACSLGADDFIRKPVSQTTLLQIFDRWVAAPWPAGPRHPGEPADI